MADPVGSVKTLIELCVDIYKAAELVKAMCHAGETMDRLRAQTDDVVHELQWLRNCFQEAACGDDAQEEFLKLYTRNIGKHGEDLGWTEGPVIEQLKRLLRNLNSELRPLKLKERQAYKERTALRKGDAKHAGDSDGRHFRPRSIRTILQKIVGRPQESKLARQVLLPFQEEEIEKELRNLQTFCEILQRVRSRVNTDLTKLIRRDAHQREEQKDLDEALRWLSPWPHRDAQLKNLDPFDAPPIDSDWFLQGEEFLSWRYGRRCRLFLYGDPGSGKSVIASQIIKQLEDQYQGSSKVAVLFLMLQYDKQETQTERSLLASLLKQLVAHYGTVESRRAVRELWRALSQDSTYPPIEDVLLLIRQSLGELERVFVIIDGLDEAKDRVRKQLVRYLTDLAGSCNLPRRDDKVSVLFTSRPLDVEQDVTRVDCNGTTDGRACPRTGLRIFHWCSSSEGHGPHFYLCQNCAASGRYCDRAPHRLEESRDRVTLRLYPPEASIERFVASLLDRELSFSHAARAPMFAAKPAMAPSDESTTLARILHEYPELRTSIINGIRDNARGLFMLARMQWQHVQESNSKTQIESALKTLPSELNDSFEQTLKRMVSRSVAEDRREEAKKVVLWVSQTRRLLSLNTLRAAMSVENDEVGLDKMALIALTRGLVTVDSDHCVRLVHRTAYEYLAKPEVKRIWFPDAQEYLAKMCLKTLQNESLKIPVRGSDENDGVEARLKRFPLLSYASQHWGFHAQLCQSAPDISKLIWSVLTEEDYLASAVQISAFCEEACPTGWTSRWTGVNAFHVAAWFGLESTFESLIGKGFSIEERDGSDSGRTPLIYACRGGRPEAVQGLLNLGADLEGRDRLRQYTPLVHAAMLGKALAVGVLCADARIDINASVTDGMTALMAAAERGHEPVITTLLGHKSLEVNRQNQAGGFTALMLAAHHDSPAALKTLLAAKNVDIDTANDAHATALHYAAQEGHSTIVRLLLEHKADPSVKDVYGATPVRRAVEEGHQAVVEVFKAQNLLCVAGSEDATGRDLLFAAAVSGRVHVARGLIASGFDTNLQARDGRTPLHDAADCANLKPDAKLEVVKCLLDAGANETLLDTHGESAADLAYSCGDFDVGDFILSNRPGVARTHVANELSALSLARRGLVEELTERASQSDHDLLLPDADGDTALAVAIRSANYECVPVILEAYSSKCERIDMPNVRNRTPMHDAAKSGEPWLVRLLLSHRPPPSLDVSDYVNATPLSEAVDSGAEESVMALLEAGAEFDRLQVPTEGMLAAAIEAGSTSVVCKLIHAGVHIAPSHRSLANKKGNADIIRLVDKHKTRLRLEPDQYEADLLGQAKAIRGVEVTTLELPSEPAVGPDMTKPKFRAREVPLLA